MRIGLVTGEFPPMEGGVGDFTQQLARELARQGAQIHIITHRQARPPKPDGARYGLGEIFEPIDLDYAQLHPRVARWSWADMSKVADIADRFDLQIINIQYQPAAYNMRSPAINFAPWRLRGLAPVVVTFHDLRVPYLFPKAGRLRRWVVYKMARLASAVIATNHADYQLLVSKVDRVRLAEIPIGSNIRVHARDVAAVAKLRSELGLERGEFLLAYFGFLNHSKGADTLLTALADLPASFHVMFVGGRTGASDATNAAFSQSIEAQITALGIGSRVHWSGFLPDREVSTHLYAADLIVLPYRDGVSLRRGTLMAALAHGRPVVSTLPSAPAPPLEHSKNIWLVPPDDPKLLGKAVAELAAQPDLRTQLAEGANQLAQQFTWDRIAANTRAFFEKLL